MRSLKTNTLFFPQWNKTFLLFSIISLWLDPLFLYVLMVNDTRKCLDVDHTLEKALCILCSFVDVVYFFHYYIEFTSANDHLHSVRVPFQRRSIFDSHGLKIKNSLKTYLLIGVIASLPLPQLAVWVIIPKLYGASTLLTKNVFKFVILSQLVIRIIRISWFYRMMTKTYGALNEKAWVGAAFNFFLYLLASHVVGAIWYLFAIESQLRCWNIALEWHNHDARYLQCGEGRVGDFTFLNTSCPLLERNQIKDSKNFDFGIFLDALQSDTLETRVFPQKWLYCLWWGMQSLSSLGQGLKVSTYWGEILLAIFIMIIDLILLALLIGNMQKYLQSLSNPNLRVEEMKEKMRQAEELMSYLGLPVGLRVQVRNYMRNKWQMTGGIDLDAFVRDLPRDLRRDIKRQLCWFLPMAPYFDKLENHLIDYMSELMKVVYYLKGSHIIQEGYPVTEMIFIGSGRASVTGGYGMQQELYSGMCFGEELLRWTLHPEFVLPITNRTVTATTDVQDFVLGIDEVKFLTSQFSQDNRMRLEHVFRYVSHPLRVWAANYIQAAWRAHCRRKQENL